MCSYSRRHMGVHYISLPLHISSLLSASEQYPGCLLTVRVDRRRGSAYHLPWGTDPKVWIPVEVVQDGGNPLEEHSPGAWHSADDGTCGKCAESQTRAGTYTAVICLVVDRAAAIASCRRLAAI